MAYSKQELLKNLIEFKNEYGRYPTRQDFSAKRIKPSKNAFYRQFGSMENAFKQAELYKQGDLVIEDEADRKPMRIKNRSEKGAQCPFCGNQIRDVNGFYSSLTKILTMRFMNRLKSGNGDSYSEAVLDCIKDVFGKENPIIKRELAVAGYLEKFREKDSRQNNE